MPASCRASSGTLKEVQDTLSSSFVVQALDSQALLTECHRCLTGLDDPVAPSPAYLSHTLASVDLRDGYIPRVGPELLFVVTITSLGTFTEAAAGDFFNSLRENVRWHMRFIGLPREQADKRIQAIQTKWFSKRAWHQRTDFPGAEGASGRPGCRGYAE